jgi:putative FmdB family regulatory protein
MPIYEYRCKRCGKISEKFLRSSQDEGSLSCAFCGEKDLKRQFSCFSSGSASVGGLGSKATGCKPSTGFR